MLRRLADTWRLTAAQAKAIGRPEAEGKIRICIGDFRPNVMCFNRTSEQYEGYQVELFRAVAPSLFWLGDARTSWFFDCVGWEELFFDVNTPGGTCMLVPTGISSDDAERLSWVVDKEGLRVLVKANPTFPLKLFSPFETLSWSLWLALAVTAVFVGACVWFCDVAVKSLSRPPLSTPWGAAGARRRGRLGVGGGTGRLAGANGGGGLLRGEGRPAYSAPHVPSGCHADGGGGGGDTHGPLVRGCSAKDLEAPSPAAGKDAGAAAAGGGKDGAGPEERTGNWCLRWLGVRKGEEARVLKDLDTHMRRSLLKFADVSEPPTALSLPAQTVLFTYGLLMLLIIAMYTAGTAARLTAAQINSNINGKDDLPGKVVGTWEGYMPRLTDQGINVVGLPWLNTENEGKMLDKLRSGEIQALVLDRNTVDYIASMDCDFVAVGTPFSIVDSGFGLALGLQQPLEEDLNYVIRDAVRAGVMEKVHNANIMRMTDTARCKDTSMKPDNTIWLNQVAGLWVMLGISVLAAGLMLCVHSVQRRHRHVSRAVSQVPAGLRTISSRVFSRNGSGAGVERVAREGDGAGAAADDGGVVARRRGDRV